MIMKLTKSIKLPTGTTIPAGTELHFSNEGLGYFEGEPVKLASIPEAALESQDFVVCRFSTRKDYNEAVKVLYLAGYKEPSSIDKGSGYYQPNERNSTIVFDKSMQKDIDRLLSSKRIRYNISKAKQPDYAIHNHGGYLD